MAMTKRRKTLAVILMVLILTVGAVATLAGPLVGFYTLHWAAHERNRVLVGWLINREELASNVNLREHRSPGTALDPASTPYYVEERVRKIFRSTRVEKLSVPQFDRYVIGDANDYRRFDARFYSPNEFVVESKNDMRLVFSRSNVVFWTLSDIQHPPPQSVKQFLDGESNVLNGCDDMTDH